LRPNYLLDATVGARRAVNRKAAALETPAANAAAFTATATGRLIPVVAARGVYRPASGDRLRFGRRSGPFCAADADYPPDTGPRSAELFAVAEAAVRVRRHFCAGGSGRSIGPSAPWAAFENKNCTGTRPPPVLLRIS
jgi:hypothetical protein